MDAMAIIYISILVLIFGSFAWLFWYVNKGIRLRNKELCEKYDSKRSLMSVGKKVVLNCDYYGDEIVYRKGLTGTITEIPPNTTHIVIQFDGYIFESFISVLKLDGVKND